MNLKPDPRCQMCDGGTFKIVKEFTAPPPLEINFVKDHRSNYQRTLIRCKGCGHFRSIHNIDLSALYKGGYANANYAGDKMRQTFERIISLPPEKSDNFWRVRRVSEFARPYLLEHQVAEKALDVGSGLAVFPYAMKEEGWQITALDPDPRQAKHAQEIAGVKSINTDFMQATGLPKFGLVSFNKVLEHVEHPIDMLTKTREIIFPGGLCYVELPDGEAAIGDSDGPNREEFTIDHPHVFSAASMALLAHRAEFRVLQLMRMREPSSKYSLFMFVTPAQ